MRTSRPGSPRTPRTPGRPWSRTSPGSRAPPGTAGRARAARRPPPAVTRAREARQRIRVPSSNPQRQGRPFSGRPCRASDYRPQDGSMRSRRARTIVALAPILIAVLVAASVFYSLFYPTPYLRQATRSRGRSARRGAGPKDPRENRSPCNRFSPSDSTIRAMPPALRHGTLLVRWYSGGTQIRAAPNAPEFLC